IPRPAPARYVEFYSGWRAFARERSQWLPLSFPQDLLPRTLFRDPLAGTPQVGPLAWTRQCRPFTRPVKVGIGRRGRGARPRWPGLEVLDDGLGHVRESNQPPPRPEGGVVEADEPVLRELERLQSVPVV